MAVRSFVFCCVMLAFSMPIEIGRAIEIDFETPFMGQAQLSDPFTDTAFPLCLAPRFKESLFEKIIPGAEDYWFSNDHGLIRNIYTKVFYQRDSSTKKLLSAPLVVVNPGIFSLSFDDGAASVGMELHKRGFHVLILPNAWSSQLRNILRKMPGDIEYEASLMISLSKEFIHHLKGQLAFNGHSSVLGFSYGAFVSLVAKYQTVRLNLDLFNDGAVLASPPFDVLKSRDNLDRYIDETVDQEMPGIFRRYEYAKTFCDKFLPLRLSGKQLKAQNTDQNEWSRIKEIAKLAIVDTHFTIRYFRWFATLTLA